ncbi:type VI secretion system baseplate subunit TssK [Gemmatimonadota bacterium]
MTRLARVVWNEGMHLAQHHFQTQSRYCEESIRFALNQLHFEPHGLAAAGFDEDALLNGVVSVTHARGIMPDGTPFHIPDADAPPLPLDIRPIFQPTEHQQTVFLTLPRLRPGSANCSLEGLAEHRYIAVKDTFPDETTGMDERSVTLGRKNLRLVLEPEVRDDPVLLPVARVKRDGSGQFVYDPGFIPPCIQIGSSQRLMELLGHLIELLERKAATLSQERRAPGDSLAQYGGQELASFWLSHAIHSGIPPLRYHLANRRSHPEALYVELARIAGALCTFSLRSDPDSVPRYDHNGLEECFSGLDRHIRDHLEITLPTTCEKVPLHRRSVRSVFTGTVRDDMCSDKAQWILGVRSEERASRVVAAVVGKVKLASQADLVTLVQTSGMSGLELEHLTRPPRELAPRAGLEYFLIKRTGALWRAIRESLEVGVWVPDEIVHADLELAVVLRPSD